MIEDLALHEIPATRGAIDPYVTATPVHHRRGDEPSRRAGVADVPVKLEMLQRAGTFKVRGAINVMLNMTASQRAQRVTAVSAGNHAIAVAYAEHALGVSATKVMIKASSVRLTVDPSYASH